MMRRLARTRPAWLLCLGILLAPACVPDFAPASELGERPQTLAIRATPPEVAPGEPVHLEALLHEPTAPLHRAWIACFADPHDLSDNCVADALRDGEALAPCGSRPDERLCVLGTDATALVSVPAWFQPVIPDADGVPTRAVVKVELVASTAPDPLTVCADALLSVRPDEQCFLAVKRVVVSHEPLSNQNPGWATFTVDEAPADPEVPVQLASPGADPKELGVDLAVELDPATVDDTVDADGAPDETFLDVLWYSDCGGFDRDSGRIRCDPPEPAGGTPSCEVEAVRWKPGQTGACHVHVVVYDGRGGVAWWSQAFEIVSP